MERLLYEREVHMVLAFRAKQNLEGGSQLYFEPQLTVKVYKRCGTIQIEFGFQYSDLDNNSGK